MAKDAEQAVLLNNGGEPCPPPPRIVLLPPGEQHAAAGLQHEEDLRVLTQAVVGSAWCGATAQQPPDALHATGTLGDEQRDQQQEQQQEKGAGAVAMPDVAKVRQAMEAALRLGTSLQARQPPVHNAQRLAKRIQSDLNFLHRCLGATAAADAGAAADGSGAGLASSAVQAVDDAAGRAAAAASTEAQGPPREEAVRDGEGGQDGARRRSAAAGKGAGGVGRMARAFTPARLQGLVNNLRGYGAELLAAWMAPGVVAVCKRFRAFPCTATPAPGAAHGPLWQAQRLRLRRGKEEQRAASRAAALSAGAAAAGPDAAAAASAATDSAQGAAAAVAGQGAAFAATEASGDGGGGEGAAGRSDGVVTAGAGSAAAEEEDWDLLSLTCEVDVVAQGGSLWLEVKNQESFGLDSEHWLGSSGSAKGLRRQVQEMLLVASAPCNAVRWRAPTVAVLFPGAADPLVVGALRDLGALVLLDMEALSSPWPLLPPPPPEPQVANLDTTTMCAWVSQVTWADPGCGCQAAELDRWAARTAQWRQCVEHQRQAPLQQELGRYLRGPAGPGGAGRRLLAADVAVEQFEVLLAQFAGPLERARWAELRGRLEVVPTRGEAGAGNLSERLTTLGDLREFGVQQTAVFGVGDRHQAVTLTANGAAVRTAQQQGVAVEAVVHRPVWLTGL